MRQNIANHMIKSLISPLRFLYHKISTILIHRYRQLAVINPYLFDMNVTSPNHILVVLWWRIDHRTEILL